MNILPIYNEDNVGDSLSKLNYNFLLLNSKNCSIQENKKENDVFLNKLETLMDDLDELIPNINYDFLEKFESTVVLLSSYWYKFEFTVQYPFNPTNGYTSNLVAGGELGDLNSSTTQNTQINILANALVKRNLYFDLKSAQNGIRNKEIVYVFRNSNGDYLSWDYFEFSDLFYFSVDVENNFYLDSRLVDIYVFPYYSAIAPTSLSLAQKNLSIDFNDKIFILNGVSQNPNKKTNGLINNNLVVYSTLDQEALDDFNETLNVTQFNPSIVALHTLIPFNNPIYAINLKKNKDTYLENFLSNSKLNKLCIDYLDQNYNPNKYVDDTIVNIVFLLYNTNAQYNRFQTNVVTNYFSDEQLSVPSQKSDFFREIENNISLKAPSSNTTFDIVFSKQDIYFDKIVTVRYIKKTRTLFSPVLNSDNPKIKIEPYWSFISANIGASYPKGVVEILNVDTAPRYVRPKSTTQTVQNTTLPQFPVAIKTTQGDFLETKTKDTYQLK